MENTRMMTDSSPADDVAAATQRLTMPARDAARRIAAHGRGMAHEIGELASELGTQARAREHRVRAAVGAQTKSAVALARKQPLIDVGVALAAGALVLGMLLKRR